MTPEELSHYHEHGYVVQQALFSKDEIQVWLDRLGAFIRGEAPKSEGMLIMRDVMIAKGVVEAAKRGWKPISGNFLLPQWVKTHWPGYVKGCEEAGFTADTQDWRVAKSIFVADDAATARAYAKGKDGPYYHYYEQLMHKLIKGGRAKLFKYDQNEPDDAVGVDRSIDDLVISGTVNDVVDQILAYREFIGDFGTLLYAGHDWRDKPLARRSMELLAEKVMPAVNAAIGQPAAAE